jgi:hypothetical protein
VSVTVLGTAGNSLYIFSRVDVGYTEALGR